MKRFYSHTSDIKHQKRTTALANYLTDLEENQAHYKIQLWKPPPPLGKFWHKISKPMTENLLKTEETGNESKI